MTKNGCYNRAPFLPGIHLQKLEAGRGGFVNVKTIFIPHRMTTECQYSRDPMGLGQKDPRCEGCKWKAGEQK